MRLLIAVPVLLALAGCAGFIKTNEVAETRARPVPPDRLLAFQTQAPDTGRVTIIRDAGFLGGGCYVAVEIERKLAARFDPGERATFYMRPGSVEIAVSPDPLGKGLCALGSSALGFDPVREFYQVTLDRPSVFRLSSRQYRRPELEEVGHP